MLGTLFSFPFSFFPSFKKSFEEMVELTVTCLSYRVIAALYEAKALYQRELLCIAALCSQL